ncbi:hypothetical protein E1B28_004264 [Marasmius oreades]|uniref:Uncharacterized protein n=1 Tax=Marasmius oreades TaxID=181124 RepID=A0A9P7UYA9_9AGAR|nr:uncharacterized protein E1B28_004264 [Marasmius oreades]KAG7096856.1 hypothetical protein E1B28_004264 [Marasmius oreades]
MSKASFRRIAHDNTDTGILDDPSHHLTGPFLPPTPPGILTPARTASPVSSPVSPWIRWAIDPLFSFQIVIIPIVAYFNWELITPLLKEKLRPVLETYTNYSFSEIPNPFAPFFQLSNLVASSPPDDPRYAKSWGDLLFIAYHIVLFSLVRNKAG